MLNVYRGSTVSDQRIATYDIGRAIPPGQHRFRAEIRS